MPRRLPATSRPRSRRRPSSPRPRDGASTSDSDSCHPERSEGPLTEQERSLGLQPRDELAYLRTPAAIRERAEAMLKYAEDGRSAWFSVDPNGLEAAVQATLSVTRQRFANPAAIPFHS